MVISFVHQYLQERGLPAGMQMPAFATVFGSAQDEITFNPRLFARIESIYEARDASGEGRGGGVQVLTFQPPMTSNRPATPSQPRCVVAQSWRLRRCAVRSKRPWAP